ncbi:fucolectin-like [Heterodontus francisci]|uniref:fucolectin-like n=1 Tax=Heterodontus francisci TaxID=7792 RepID=UPI00355B500C
MKFYYLLVFACLWGIAEAHHRAGNVAATVRATQSSTFRFFADADNAIDGNRNPRFRDSSCSSTTRQRDPWWRVDLHDCHRIFLVRITGRNRAARRLNGAQIRIGDSLQNNGNSNTLCATIDSIGAGETKSFFCQGTGVHGRFVNIFLPSPRQFLTLCEVEVFGALDPH